MIRQGKRAPGQTERPEISDQEPLLDDFLTLLAIERESEKRARSVGIPADVELLLLAVCGSNGNGSPTIGELARTLGLGIHATGRIARLGADLGLVTVRPAAPVSSKLAGAVLALTQRGSDSLQKLSEGHGRFIDALDTLSLGGLRTSPRSATGPTP